MKTVRLTEMERDSFARRISRGDALDLRDLPEAVRRQHPILDCWPCLLPLRLPDDAGQPLETSSLFDGLEHATPDRIERLLTLLRDTVGANLPLWLLRGGRCPDTAEPVRLAVWSRVIAWGGFACPDPGGIAVDDGWDEEEPTGAGDGVPVEAALAPRMVLASFTQADVDRLLGAVSRWDADTLTACPDWAKREFLAAVYAGGHHHRDKGRAAVKAVLRGCTPGFLRELVDDLLGRRFVDYAHRKGSYPEDQAGLLIVDAWREGVAVPMPAVDADPDTVGTPLDHMASVLAFHMGAGFGAYLTASGAPLPERYRKAAVLLAGGAVDAAGGALERAALDALVAEATRRRKPIHLLLAMALLPVLLKDTAWEMGLHRRLAEVDPEADDTRLRGLEEVAQMLLEACPELNLELWGPLVERWLKLAQDQYGDVGFFRDARVTARWVAWFNARADAQRSPVEVVDRLLKADGAVLHDDLKRLSRHLGDPAVRRRLIGVLDPRAPDRDLRDRAIWLLSGIVEQAEAVSVALLELAVFAYGGSWRARRALDRGLFRLARADRDAFEDAFRRLDAPEKVKGWLRASSDPVTVQTYEVLSDRLRRLKDEDWAKLRLFGECGRRDERFSVVVLTGVGKAGRLDSISDAYAVDIELDERGHVKGYTGRSQFSRVPGRVRPLRDGDVACIRKSCARAAAGAGEVLARRSADVQDVIERANAPEPEMPFAPWFARD